MKTKISVDKQKSKSLQAIAKVTLERLKETKKEKYPANTLTDYYDILKKLMEALNYLDGIKFRGEGAHIETINYICKRFNLGETIRIFLQQMRDYRNRISYEGFNVNVNYIKINYKRIEEIIETLNDHINEKSK